MGSYCDMSNELCNDTAFRPLHVVASVSLLSDSWTNCPGAVHDALYMQLLKPAAAVITTFARELSDSPCQPEELVPLLLLSESRLLPSTSTSDLRRSATKSSTAARLIPPSCSVTNRGCTLGWLSKRLSSPKSVRKKWALISAPVNPLWAFRRWGESA